MTAPYICNENNLSLPNNLKSAPKKKLQPKRRSAASFRQSRMPAIHKRASLAQYTREIPAADIKELTLPNGFRIVSERIAGAPSVAVGVWVDVGSRDEAATEYGTAHFIEHVVFKETERYSMKEIMNSIESRGGMLNAFTTKEHTCFYTWNRVPYLEDAVSVLSDLVLRPAITESAVKREKDVIIEEIHGLDDEPDELVFDLFEETLFKATGLAHPVIGTVDSVSGATKRSLRSFHDQHYIPENITLVASGSQSHNDLFKYAKKYFADIAARKSDYQREVIQQKILKGKRVKDTREGIGQAHIIIGRLAPGMNSPKEQELSLLITLLGVGMSSRLNLRLREELALAYETSAFHAPFAETGAVGLYAAVTEENAKKTEAEMKRIVRGLFTKPITEQEIERTKEQVIGSLILGLESMTSRMMRAGQHISYYHTYQELAAEIKEIQQVSRRSILDLAEELFSDETLLSVVSIASHS